MTDLIEPLRQKLLIDSNRLAAVRWSQQETLGLHDKRVLVWFSCGAASAVVLKLLAPLNPVAVYCDTSSDEDDDNPRFMRDVEEWTGVKVLTIGSKVYKNCSEVFEARRFMSSKDGAPCTVQLKKVPRWEFQTPEDVHCFGMTLDETMPHCKRPQDDRIAKFENGNPDMHLSWPLRDAGINKELCLTLVEQAGIKLPDMYLRGYKNNNCKGCVKASSPHYWNMTRRDFPEVFENRAKQSRDIGCRLVRFKGERIFLDQLPESATEVVEEDLSCGPQCSPNISQLEINVTQADPLTKQRSRDSPGLSSIINPLGAQCTSPATL